MPANNRAGRIRSWMPLLASCLVPGAGHALLGRPRRGLLMVFWIVLSGSVTFLLSGATDSLFGRFSGGFAVWVLSILEVARILRGIGDRKAS